MQIPVSPLAPVDVRIRLGLLALSGVVLLGVAPSARSTRPADPDLGPNVLIFDPSMPRAAIQATLDSVYSLQEKSEFGDGRVALLFKPGRYDVDARVGYYTEVAGLGLTPDEPCSVGDVAPLREWLPRLSVFGQRG